MNTDRTCGCKGFNSCLICEAEFGIESSDPAQERIDQFEEEREFCIDCSRLFNKKNEKNCCEKTSEEPVFQGIKIIRDFITSDEENTLLEDLDEAPWTTSQSGRRKQNYGPRANFKKRKAKLGAFQGFPMPTKFIQERFKTVSSIQDYKTVEQCSIEYRPEMGACINPHIDDCWIWGERIVQLNLMSDTYLTLVPFEATEPMRYNLPDVAKYPKIMNEDTGEVQFNPFEKKNWDNCESYPIKNSSDNNYVVRVPLPRRSLLILYGNPRYNWEHCVLRKDISSRRIVIAYRELTPTYLPNGLEESIGQEILEKAENFF